MQNGDVKRIIKNTAFTSSRMLFLMIVSFFTTRIVMQSLGFVDYGINNVVGGLTSMLVFFRSSLSNVTQRYLNIELANKNQMGARQVFCQHQSLYIVIAVVIVLLAETCGLWFFYHKLVIPPNRQTAAFWVYQFMIASVVLTILSIVYDSAIIAHENFKAYAYVGIYEGIAKLGIAYFVKLVPWDRLITYALLVLILSVSVRIIYMIICRRNYLECHFSFTFKRDTIRETSSMIGWNTVGTLVWALNDQGIDILLNMFFGPVINAARGITKQVNAAVTQFSNSFFLTVRPQITKNYAMQDQAALIRIVLSSSKYGFFIIWIIALPIILSIDTLLRLWLHDVPEHTNKFAVLAIIFSLVDTLNNPLWSLALSTGRLRRYVLECSGIWICVFPVSYVLLKLGYCPESVFVANILFRSAYVVAAFLIVKKNVPIPVISYTKEVLRPIVCTIAISLTICLILDSTLPSSAGKWIWLSLWSVLVSVVTIWSIGLSDGERTFFLSSMKNYLSSIHRHK